MYYKIENKECEVYQRLHELRTKELRFEKENINLIEEKTGLKWDKFLGNQGQQNWRRVTEYTGFCFLEPEKVDLKIWKRHNEHKDIFVPNRRTNVGREMEDFLNSGLNKTWYHEPLGILGIKKQRKFTFPFVEICGDIIVIFLGNNDDPKDENVIEITKKEFESIRNKDKN